MTDRYVKIVDKSDLKNMTEKSVNIANNGVEEIKCGKKYHNIVFS